MPKILNKDKKCKTCLKNKRFTGRTECYQCIRKGERKRKEEKAKRKLEKHKLTKTYQEKVRKTLKKKAWRLMSYCVRKGASDWRGNVECYTCGKVVPFKEAQAGHRHHGKLDLDERNIHVQCVGCNLYLSGNLGNYEHRLIQENGLEWAKELKRDADRFKGYTLDELRVRIDQLEDLKKIIDSGEYNK